MDMVYNPIPFETNVNPDSLHIAVLWEKIPQKFLVYHYQKWNKGN
jgi:hypothetical protein